MCLAGALPVTAQQRIVIDPGFEANNPFGPGSPAVETFPASAVPGWEASTDEIELWDTGYDGVSAYEGAVFAEMNANSPGTLYQNVCFMNGEVLRWQFAHRARAGGAANQTANFEIANSAGTVLQTLAVQVSTTSSAAWTLNTSPGGGVTYTGPTGIQRLQFSTTDPGSVGNFLDGVRIFLSPYLEMNGATTSGIEGGIGQTLPGLTISGEVTSAISVTINVTGGTATRGVDYTTPNGAASFTVAIPAGTYDMASFPLGIAILNDTTIEPSETIQLSMAANAGSYTLASTSSCGAAAQTTTTHTIVDDDTPLTVSKTSIPVSDPVNLTTNPKFIPGSTLNYVLAVANPGAAPVTANTIDIRDPCPTNLRLFVGDLGGAGSGPVIFTDGSPSSTLTYTYSSLASMTDDVEFSNNNGASWSYVPVPDAQKFDAAVTNIRIRPKGSMASGSSLQLRFQFMMQ